MQTQSEKDKQATEDAAIIDECIRNMQDAISRDGDNRRMALDDLTFVNGDQWDPTVKADRVADRRPCLTINKLPTTVHQLTNTQRQNVPSIKVHPISDGTKKLAEIVQGGIRAIEYRSLAHVCYDTAVNNAATMGFGYFRLVTEYESPDSFNQQISFKRIRNPFTVYPGPHINPDGSDMQWCVISEMMTRTQFKLEHPDMEPASFEAVKGMGDRFADWASETHIRVAEYYRIFRKAETVLLLSNGETGYESDLVALPAGISIVKKRASFRETVQWFKLNATQIVERTDIPCKWIPVFPVYGSELDINGKIYRSGIVRNAKDPARMYNYWMTCATEEIGLRQRVPYIGAEGQFEGHEDKWRMANTRSFPYLEYKQKTLAGQLAPPPQRQPMTDVPVGVLSMASHANEDIKATTGYFDASLGAVSNETSGKAINARDRQGETSNFHYTDNLHTTVIHAGRCIIDMWPKVYDGTRTLELMGEDKKVSSVEINKPDPKNLEQVVNDMTKAKFSCTVSAGPSYDTIRQEAVEGMIETARNWPKLMDVAGDKVIRAMDWPYSDQIADRVQKTIPPELRTGEDGENQTPEDMVMTPKGPIRKDEVGTLLEKMESQMAEMGKALEEAEAGVDKARVTAEANVEIAKIKAFSAEKVEESRAFSAEEVEELRGYIALLKEKMKPPAALAADVAAGGSPASAVSTPG